MAKRKKKTKKLALVIIVVLLLVGAAFAVPFISDVMDAFRDRDQDYDFVQEPDDEIPPPPPNQNGEGDEGFDYVIDPDRVNVLLIGVDKRQGSSRAPLSDTIMIFSFHKGNKSDPVLMSFPRDTYVDIPGKYKDKINHSHAFGGQALLRESLEKFTGIPIDYYLRVNFEGFAGIVDMLGGVDIYVDRDIKHLRKGQQVLNGADALTFVRDRNEARGDFARAERQQRFLVATAKQVQSQSLHRLPSLIREGAKFLDTDMPILTALDFGQQFSNVDSDAITRYLVTGEGFYHERVYYLRPNRSSMYEFIAQHMAVK